MKKVLQTMLLLALAGGLSLVLLAVFPGLRYHLDDTKLQWIGRELAKPPGDYDYVFIGSSHIWNAMDAPLIGRVLSGDPRKAINLGINWGGRDVQGLIAREFITRHRVRNLVLEAWHYEYPRSHDYFPFLSLPGDVLRHVEARRLFQEGLWNLKGDFKGPVDFIVSQLAASMVKAYPRLFDLLRPWSGAGKGAMAEYDRHRGYLAVKPPEAARAAFLAQAEDFTTPPKPSEYDPAGVEGGQEWTVWHSELTRLAALCRQKGVRLIFLFLPHRANQRPSPRYLDYLGSLGEVVDLPREIMAAKVYWRDASHLSVEGAERYSRYFIARERSKKAGRGGAQTLGRARPGASPAGLGSLTSPCKAGSLGPLNPGPGPGRWVFTKTPRRDGDPPFM